MQSLESATEPLITYQSPMDMLSFRVTCNRNLAGGLLCSLCFPMGTICSSYSSVFIHQSAFNRAQQVVEQVFVQL